MRALAVVLALAAGPVAAQDSCDGAITTVDINACASDIFAAEDDALNEAYQAALAQAREWDAEAAEFDGPADAEDRLRTAQRAWLAYRDVACDADPYVFRNGSAATMNFLGCLSDLTRQRTEVLLDFTEF